MGALNLRNPNYAMKRRDFLRRTSLSWLSSRMLGAASLSQITRAADIIQQPSGTGNVSWLADVQSWLTRPRSGSLPIAVLPGDQPLRRQQELRNWWQHHLGLRGTPQRAPRWTLLGTEKVDGVLRQLIRYESEPGWEVEAYLLQPEKLTRTQPGFVVFHSTVAHSILQPAGLGNEPEKALGWELARLGYTALCPRNYLWPTNDRLEADRRADQFLRAFPQSTGMAKMLWDASVAVSLLAGLPGVDPQRLGAIGHSLGGKEVLYLAAFDERVRVGVSSEGGVGVSFSNWDAPWYLGSAAARLGGHDHHELVALCAPRPFLLVGGDSADGAASEAYLLAAWPVWQAQALAGQQPALGLLNHHQGHALPAAAASQSLEWLTQYC